MWQYKKALQYPVKIAGGIALFHPCVKTQPLVSGKLFIDVDRIAAPGKDSVCDLPVAVDDLPVISKILAAEII